MFLETFIIGTPFPSEKQKNIKRTDIINFSMFKRTPFVDWFQIVVIPVLTLDKT